MSLPSSACPECLRRSWLLVRLAAHLERGRTRVLELLALGDEELVDAVAGRRADTVSRELVAFDAEPERQRLVRAAVTAICRHDRFYPPALKDLEAPPAALFLAGDLELLRRMLASYPVAIVGSRRAVSYGREMAGSLARQLSGAGMSVISGMALGVDGAAHRGALAGPGGTIAVLAAGPERPHPAANRSLHLRIQREGAVLSELPPGSAAWRWAFPARNRIIAALAAMTIVVEASERSGALITAEAARQLGRPVGAVPGCVGSPGAAGPNALLAEGARIIRGGQDVLDAVFGVGLRKLEPVGHPPLSAAQAMLLEQIAAGRDTEGALAVAGLSPEQGLAELAELELAGHLHRRTGGGFTVTS